MVLVKGTNCGFVTEAPTSDPGGGNIVNSYNYAKATRDTTPASTITIKEIGFYIDNDTSDGDCEVGIYTNDGTNLIPKDLVGKSDPFSKGTGAGWRKATVDIKLNASTIYWIAAQVDGTSEDPVFNWGSVTGAREAINNVGLDYLPDTWTNGSEYSDTAVAIYALYEAAPTGKNIYINIDDAYKQVAAAYVNVDDAWKEVTDIYVNVDDAWKTV